MANIENGLVNSTAFAKLCGVAPQTVLNWVKNKKIIPAQEVGGKYFFSKENYYQVQLDVVKGFETQSFLGVIVEDSQEKVIVAEAKFIQAVKDAMPSANKIASVKDALEKMAFGDSSDSNERLDPVVIQKVVSSFTNDVKDLVLNFVFDIYKNVSGSESFSLSFFLDLIFKNEVDSSLLDSYNSLSISNTNYLSDNMSLVVDMHFRDLKRKYGVSIPCSHLDVSLEDIYKGNISSLIDAEGFSFDSGAPKAKAIYDSISSSVRNKSAKLALQSIFEDGYFTTLTSVGSLSADIEAFVFKSLFEGSYKTFYISNRELLSKQLCATLDELAKANRIILLEV